MPRSSEPHRTQTNSAGWKSWLLPALLCLLFFINGLNDAFQNSAVADELGGHTASGYLYWLSGEYSGGVANFPLAHLLIALPVVLLGYSYELFSEEHLILFRLPVLLMGLLLGITLYRFTAELFSRKAALAALLLLALSPNILAHASLATLDLPIAFFVFLTAYTLWRYVQRPHWVRMLALSLALACALATKIQAVLLIPLIALVLVVYFGPPLVRRQKPVALLWSWVLLPVVPWIFINLVYLNIPLYSGPMLPKLFLDALELKLRHAEGSIVKDQVTYLMGEYSSTGLWYYFPLAILLKTPLPTLALLLLGIVRKPSRESLLFAVIPAAMFLGITMLADINIGLRHVLIVYPFLFMLAAWGAERLWSRSWRGVALIGLGGAYLWQAAMIPPHHLSYFNILAGGPADGHKFLIDSNHDWGQNDHFLRRYVEDRGLDYKINPDAFEPTTGHILVNVNAFYGVYNHGGPEAYVWLRRFEPVNQIAYTWFEYDIPEDAFPNPEEIARHVRATGVSRTYYPWNESVSTKLRDEWLEQIDRHLRDLQRRHDEITNPHFHTALAYAFVATASYDGVLEEVRRLLEQDPSSLTALGLGGELTVRWKLGILKFDGDEYLTGPVPSDAGADQPPPDAGDVARYAKLLGISQPISRVHYVLSVILRELGRGEESFEQYQIGERIAPLPEKPAGNWSLP